MEDRGYSGIIEQTGKLMFQGEDLSCNPTIYLQGGSPTTRDFHGVKKPNADMDPDDCFLLIVRLC